MNYHQQMQAEAIYHIYGRAVGDERLFNNEENYRFFLAKYRLHISNVADTFAWCLLPNHFHMLIQIKSLAEIEAHFKLVKTRPLMPPGSLPDFVMERFSNLLNSYTKAFNKVNERKRSLFTDYMRRVAVSNDQQFGSTVFYTRKNPVHHGLVKRIEDWRWSSYKSFFSTAATSLQRDKVLQWFQGADAFESYHHQPVYLKNAVFAGD